MTTFIYIPGGLEQVGHVFHDVTAFVLELSGNDQSTVSERPSLCRS